jgi:hypothetical protein
MVGESLAIAAVIVVMVVMLARAGRQGFAVLALPLLGVPVLHLIGWLLPPMAQFMPSLDLAGLAVGVILSVILSGAFRRMRARVGYIALVSIFLAALTVGYLISY